MYWSILFRIRENLRGSLWVVPVAGGIVGVLLARLIIGIDQNADTSWAGEYSPGAASTFLSTMAAAMVGLLGFVVTIGVLIVQQATGTLSPRFMRLWYRDNLQKAVLAMFLATLTYSLVLLREAATGSVPYLGVSLAALGVMISLVLFLLFLDRFTHLLRPVAVAAQVAASGRKVVESEWRVAATTKEDALPFGQTPSLVVRSERAGAIQAINVRGLVGIARRHDCVLVLPHSVGDFVPTGARVVEVFGATMPRGERRLRWMFALGRERTLEQDPAFALRILVDIAIRALSPAVNDPTSAVQVLDHIEDFILLIGSTDLRGHRELRDAAGRPRVFLPARRWEDYLALAVTEIRQYGAVSMQVSRRLRAMLVRLEESVRPENREAVLVELQLLEDSVRRHFTDARELEFASASDRQGIGEPTPLKL